MAAGTLTEQRGGDVAMAAVRAVAATGALWGVDGVVGGDVVRASAAPGAALRGGSVWHR